MKESYPIPKEICDIRNKAVAYDRLFNVYVKLPLGYKKALKTSIEHAALLDEFWTKIYSLYPKLRHIPLSYTAGEIYINETEEETK